LNKRLQAVQPSPTLALNEKAGQLREQGKDLIHLGIGEPQNECPSQAVRYASDTLAARKVKYSPTGGDPGLKDRIIDYTKNYYGRTPAQNQVMVTVGAKQSLANLLFALLNPGDEVILLAPYWVSYPEMTRLAGALPVVVPPREDLLPTLQDIKKARSPATRVIILNSPNNPSGVVYPPELIAALVDFCETEGIYLIMDDIYHQLVFPGNKWVPGYVFSSQDIEHSRIIVVNGISKTFGMTGFRVGWTVAPTPIIDALKVIQGHTTSGTSILLQEGARGALAAGREPIENLKDFIQTNQDLLLAGLRKIPGVRVTQPGGTFYCFPDFSSLYPDSTELADLLLSEAYLVTVPGGAFGMDGHLRLSCVGPPERISESIRRFRWVLDPEAPRTITMGNQEHTCTWKRSREG